MASSSHGGQALTSSQLLDMTATAVPVPAESASQPFPDAFRHRVSDDRGRRRANKRPITLSQPIVETTSILQTDYQGLRRQVFSEVVARLGDVGVRIEDMDPLLFSFLLPGPTADVQAWNDLLNVPIFLSPEKLRTMFSLTPADQVPRAEGPTTVFYVRTFQFFLEEFLYLIQLFIDEYGQHLPEQILTWQRLIARLGNNEDSETSVYLRYIGVTTQQAGASIRLYQDLTAKKTQGFNGDFLRLCRNEFPAVIADAQVDVFDKATIDIPLRHSQGRIVDSREQALIAEFGHSTLLNSSIGGNDAVIEFYEQDNIEFSSFNTQTISRLEWQTSPMMDIGRLQTYGRTAQLYASRNPISTNHTTYPITNEVRDLVVNQSIPATCNGHAILVTVGSDLGPESHETMMPFYHGGVRSSELTVRVLENMVHSELGHSTTTLHRIPALQSQHFLPFVDLYPWARKDDQDLLGALQILRRYLHVANPVIVLTFSELVSGVCLGYCHHRNGLRRGQSISKVSGELFMSKYDHDPLENEDDHCFIVIPCVHPGSLRYSNDNKPLGRIFAKSLAVAWLAMHTALDILQKPGQNKRAICEAVIERVRSQTGPDTQFGKTFLQVRVDYVKTTETLFRKRYEATSLKFQRILERTDKIANSRSEQNLLAVADSAHTGSRFQIQWNAASPQLPAAVVRCKNALEQLYKITDCDIAHGAADSDDRQVQVKRLVSMYGTVLNVRGLSNKEFTKVLSKVKDGEWYYFAMTVLSDQSLDLSHLLSFFVAKDIDIYDPTWLSDDNTVQGAVKNLKTFMSNIGTTKKERLEVQTKISTEFQDLLRKKSKTLLEAIQQLRRWQPFKTTTYAGSPHKVLIKILQEQKCGLMEFQWEHEGNVVSMSDFYIPMAAAPILPGEDRFIAFTESGIDIQDARGRSLATTLHRPVTVPIDQLMLRLANHPLRAEFVQLWQAETGRTIYDAMNAGPSTSMTTNSRTEVAYAYPKDFYQGSGHGLPMNLPGKSEANKFTNLRKDQLPFKPADIGWFFHKLLQTKYPNGGEVELGSPDVWPECPSFWTDLRAFLEEPLYTNLPYRDTLLAACDGIKNVGRAGQGPGKKDQGYQIIRAVSRLIHAIREPFSEKPVEKKSKNLRRTKSVLTIGAKVPEGAIADVEDPQLEAIEIITRVEDLENESDDDDNADDGENYEATPFEIQQQQTMLRHFAELKSEGKDVPPDLQLDDVEMVEDSQPVPEGGPAKATAHSSKRRRDDESSGKHLTTVKMQYGIARYKFADSDLLNWSQKYGWNLKHAKDDDEVEVEAETGGSEEEQETENRPVKKRARATGSGKDLSAAKKPSNDDDNDDEMLITF